MSKIRKYKDFVSEELFGLFKKEETKKTAKKDRIESCVNNILNFLKDNQIEDWNDFMSMKTFDREIINRLIDSETKNMDELKEVRFEIKLRLSDNQQRREMVKEYEEKEEYEKCSRILKKIKNG
jgi:hypothetical protein